MRNTAIILICTMISVAFSAVRGVAADEVILTTGERFTSSKVWEENGKIIFDIQGLIVNVNKREVAAVVRDTYPAKPSAALPGQPVPGRQNTSPPALDPLPAEKPVLPGTPADPVDRDYNRKPKIPELGLDGLAWQMHPNEITGIAKLGTDPSYGGIDQYWRPGGNLTLGDALLDGLVIGFWHNRLYTIMMWVDGKPGYIRLRRTVLERYGSGRKNNQGLERYIWIDDTTDRMLEFDRQRNAGIFWMRSRDLDMQVRRLYPVKKIRP
jgi:hypothetical protein